MINETFDKLLELDQDTRKTLNELWTDDEDTRFVAINQIEDALRRYFELGVHHALSVARGVLAGREGPYFADLRSEEELRP